MRLHAWSSPKEQPSKGMNTMLKIIVLLVMLHTPGAEVQTDQAGSYASMAECKADWEAIKADAQERKVPTNNMVGFCIETPWAAPGSEI